MSVIGGRPKKKKHANSSYKTTKHIERTFLVQRLITEVLYLWVKSIREEFSQHFCVSFRFSSFCGVKNHSFLSLSQCFAHHFGSELDYPSKQKEVQCWNCYSSDNNVTKNQQSKNLNKTDSSQGRMNSWKENFEATSRESIGYKVVNSKQEPKQV